MQEFIFIYILATIGRPELNFYCIEYSILVSANFIKERFLFANNIYHVFCCAISRPPHLSAKYPCSTDRASSQPSTPIRKRRSLLLKLTHRHIISLPAARKYVQYDCFQAILRISSFFIAIYRSGHHYRRNNSVISALPHSILFPVPVFYFT